MYRNLKKIREKVLSKSSDNWKYDSNGANGRSKVMFDIFNKLLETAGRRRKRRC